MKLRWLSTGMVVLGLLTFGRAQAYATPAVWAVWFYDCTTKVGATCGSFCLRLTASIGTTIQPSSSIKAKHFTTSARPKEPRTIRRI